MACSSSSFVDKGKQVETEEPTDFDLIKQFVAEEVRKVEGTDDLEKAIILLATSQDMILNKVNEEVVKGILSRTKSLVLFLTRPIYEVSIPRPITLLIEAVEGEESGNLEPRLAELFQNFRRDLGLSEKAYQTSLRTFKPWNPQGGKSNCLFMKSGDDTLIMKEVHSFENDWFLKFAESYVNHLIRTNESCLVKIFGIYQVNGRPVIVMENLLHGQKIFRLYDIKGVDNSARIGKAGVLLDRDFISDMEEPLFLVEAKSKSSLLRSLGRDTSFLESVGVMDYSMLLVVNKEMKKIACGVIDYLSPYTGVKKLESLIKSLRDGGSTVVAPAAYAARLRLFVEKHMLTRKSLEKWL